MGVARGGSKLQQLVDWFESNGPKGTTLQTPQGGADLLQQVPEIARWIVATAPKDRQLVLVPLAYMDGEACVRVTVAMDTIVTHVMEHRKDVSLAYLVSPATVYPIPREAAQDAEQRYVNEGFTLARAASFASLGMWAKPTNVWNEEKSVNSLAIYNGLVHLQGPNYALAKTMQQWRCMTAHASGYRVVAPHAPPTRTYSVVHSAAAATALEGLNRFPPNLAFDVFPCSSLMTAILLDKLKQHEEEKSVLINHPLELFWDGSVHGGCWRCPYSTDSCGALGYILGRTICQQGSSPEASMAPRPRNTSTA